MERLQKKTTEFGVFFGLDFLLGNQNHASDFVSDDDHIKMAHLQNISANLQHMPREMDLF